MGTQTLVIAGRSFMDTIDYSQTIKEIHLIFQGGIDKKPFHYGGYSGSHNIS